MAENDPHGVQALEDGEIPDETPDDEVFISQPHMEEAMENAERLELVKKCDSLEEQIRDLGFDPPAHDVPVEEELEDLDLLEERKEKLKSALRSAKRKAKRE